MSLAPHSTIDNILPPVLLAMWCGESSKGFLGVQFLPVETPRCSDKTVDRLTVKLTEKFAHAARLYEQGRLYSLESTELYLTHWLRWSKGIGIAVSGALDFVKETLNERWIMANNVMHEYFAQSLIDWVENKTQKTKKNDLKKEQEIWCITRSSISWCDWCV